MYGGISLIGWFHTVIGIAGILSGLYLLIRYKFINPKSNLGMFYLKWLSSHQHHRFSFIVQPGSFK
jgi:hypothetical protein